MRLHPGLEIHPEASAAFASAEWNLDPGARVRIGPRVATERRHQGVRITVRSGGELIVGEDTWLRSDLCPVILTVYEDARIHVGPDGFLNGAQLSAKRAVVLGQGLLGRARLAHLGLGPARPGQRPTGAVGGRRAGRLRLGSRRLQRAARRGDWCAQRDRHALAGDEADTASQPGVRPTRAAPLRRRRSEPGPHLKPHGSKSCVRRAG